VVKNRSETGKLKRRKLRSLFYGFFLSVVFPVGLRENTKAGTWGVSSP